MSDKKIYVKEGRKCKVLPWAGKGEKPGDYPRVGTLYIAHERVGRSWFCERVGGEPHFRIIPANCLAVVPEKAVKQRKTRKPAVLGADAGVSA